MKQLLWLIPFGVLLLLGCRSEVNLDAPPEILYGQDVGDECGMIINDPRFAAAYVTEQGETRRFDDIGDMLLYHLKHQEEVHAFWVHDVKTEEWVRTDDATLVMNENLVTPMGWGLAAYADAAAAEAYVTAEGGVVTSFEHLLQAADAGELDPVTLQDHIHRQHDSSHDHSSVDQEDMHEMHSQNDG